MTKVNPNIGNEQNQTFFHGTYLTLTSFFIGCKMLEILQLFFIISIIFQFNRKSERKQVK